MAEFPKEKLELRQPLETGTVGKMLASPVYKGCILYQQTYVKDPFTRKQVINQGELPQYYIEDHHPAIIPPEEWEAVQKIRESKQIKFTVKSGEISQAQNFHQIFRCGECGGAVSHRMHYDQQDPKKRARHYWRCLVAAGRNNASTCTAPSFREEYGA